MREVRINSKTETMKMRPLEMAVALASGIWYSGVMIEIPDDTPEEEISEIACRQVLAHLYDEEVGHVWVYNYMEDSRPEKIQQTA